MTTDLDDPRLDPDAMVHLLVKAHGESDAAFEEALNRCVPKHGTET